MTFPRYAGRRQRPDSRWVAPAVYGIDDVEFGCRHLDLVPWDDRLDQHSRFGQAYLCRDCGTVLRYDRRGRR